MTKARRSTSSRCWPSGSPDGGSARRQAGAGHGASRGIGAATAIALGAAGTHVVLTARSPKGLEEVEETIFNAGGSATIAPLDLAENESIGRLAAAIGERWQALDVMVLNAGMLGSLAAVPAIDPRSSPAS